MQIEKIELENYKKLRSLVLTLEGNNLHISGPTAQGKTTAISALWELIEMVGEPITVGEAKGRVKITLADGKKKVFAERRFTAKTKNLTVVTSEGETISAAEFKSWFCSLAVNPQDLLRLKPTELVNTLMQCVTFPEGFDLGQIEQDLIKAEQDRTEANRAANYLQKDLGPAPERAEPVSLEQATAVYKDALAKKETWDKAVENINKTKTRLQEIETELARLLAEKDKLATWLPGAQDWVDKNPPQVAEAEKTLNNLAAINEKAQVYRNWAEKSAELSKLLDAHTQAANDVARLRQVKKEGLESAVWPIPGLSVDDGTIYFNSVPFDQAGDSQKMLICGALAAEQIKTKKLRVVRMDATESMSPEDFETLCKIFNDNQIQVLSTRVSYGDARPGELVISEGVLQ